MNRLILRATAGAALLTLAAGALHAATVKVAFIDPLSGPFANIGKNSLAQVQFGAERVNSTVLKDTGHRLEIVPLDNKGSPAETLNALKLAIDQGARYVIQGNGSGAGLALIDAINKHNERNPGQELVYLNYTAQDPLMTNEKCSFWHFRFEANSDMKIEALTTELARDKAIKRVFIIGQNYAFGQQISRAAKEYLARKRPDIQIVGDELHPFGQVKDFAPYVAKIKASNADAVITGNWGNDLTLLVRAAKDAGLTTMLYTLGAGYWGAPTAMGDAADGRVRWLHEWLHNTPPYKTERQAQAFKAKFGADYALFRVDTMMSMFATAIRQARSVEPVRVAYALEGMKFATDTGEVEMRATDHQIQNPLFIGTLVKSAARGGDKTVKNDLEGTGLGFRTDVRIESYVASQPTSCQMTRPARPQ